MKSRRWTLMSSTLVSAVIGAGIVMGSGLALSNIGYADMRDAAAGLLPVAQPKPGLLQIAQCSPCSPCAAKSPCNPCNPCAAKSPCAAAAGACNPCNPCAAGAGGASSKCVVPRLQAALSPCNPCAAKAPCNPCAAKSPCNPCATKSPCNPCAAKAPCNPCAAKSPCNPCAAKNPCNPCAAAAACNPCNPCGAAKAVEITAEEAKAVYECLNREQHSGEMKDAYEKANVDLVRGYQQWAVFSTAPYQSATHGNRYVTNHANATAATSYGKFENVGKMPVGSVLAKDSFVVNPDGTVAVGPLFAMQKMDAGFNAESDDWMYMMIMANGSVSGATNGVGANNVKFCAECHATVKDAQDSLFFLPEEFRAK